MDLEIQTTDGITLATLSGDFDGRTAPDVQQQFTPYLTPNCKLLLDMSGVRYMSSAGLRVLLYLFRQCSAQRGQIALAAMPEMIHETLEITGFLAFFQTYATTQEAIAEFN